MASTSWDGARLATVTVTWVVMTVAMMLPSAAPMVLAHAGVAHRRHGAARGWRLVVAFAAGAYQLTAWKRACLRQCRITMSFVLHEWQDDTLGDLRMGVRHGLTCTGCCLGLMIVMFSVGAMSLTWMAVVTAIVAAEKVVPGGHRIATIGGGALVTGGVWVTIGAPMA